MARRLGFTPFFYALTVVALATSLPELVVNSAHAVRGNYSLVVDDVYRSIVFNILAVLGLTATPRSLVVDRESVQSSRSPSQTYWMSCLRVSILPTGVLGILLGPFKGTLEPLGLRRSFTMPSTRF